MTALPPDGQTFHQSIWAGFQGFDLSVKLLLSVPRRNAGLSNQRFEAFFVCAMSSKIVIMRLPRLFSHSALDLDGSDVGALLASTCFAGQMQVGIVFLVFWLFWYHHTVGSDIGMSSSVSLLQQV